MSDMQAVLLEQLAHDFANKGNDDADPLDADNEYDWYAITLGWAIAKGLNSEDAHDFAWQARYIM